MWFIPISSMILYNNNNITTKFTFSSCSLVWNYLIDRDLQCFYSSSSFFLYQKQYLVWDLFIHAHNVITHTRISTIRISNSGIFCLSSKTTIIIKTYIKPTKMHKCIYDACTQGKQKQIHPQVQNALEFQVSAWIVSSGVSKE